MSSFLLLVRPFGCVTALLCVYCPSQVGGDNLAEQLVLSHLPCSHLALTA